MFYEQENIWSGRNEYEKRHWKFAANVEKIK